MFRLIVVVGLCMFALNANADNTYICGGVVNGVVVKFDGSVMLKSNDIYGDGSSRVVCSLDGEWKGVSQSSCKGWLAQLLTAKLTQESMRIQYTDQYFDCPDQPTGSNANGPKMIFSD